jgi:hypothetical protein
MININYIARKPRDPRAALENAYKIKEDSYRLIGFDQINDEIVIFDYNQNQNIYNGHVRNIDELDEEYKKILFDVDAFNKK